MVLYISTRKNNLKGFKININMDNEYNKEYEKILKDIKYKLEKISFPEMVKKEFFTCVKLIEESDKSDELSYQNAITSLLRIEKDLEKYMYKLLLDTLKLISSISIENNYQKEKNEKETELKLAIIKNNLSISLSRLKDTNAKIKEIKTRIVTYISILSLLLTLTSYTLIKFKNSPREKLYQTYKQTYTTVDDTIEYSSEYLPLETGEYITIRECNPWIIEGFECKRKIITYNISNIAFENIINYDIDTFLKNYQGTSSNEYQYEKDLTTKDEYEDKIYEVIKTTQNKEVFIDAEREPKELFTLLMSLLSQVLLYITIIEINDGSLLESILIEINELIKNKQLSKDQVKLLKKYAKEFEKIVREKNPSQKTLKKVNKIIN